MAALTAENIKAVSGNFNPKSIRTLRIVDGGFSDVSILASCVNLEDLNLSGNNLSATAIGKTLSVLSNLRTLNLSFNSIDHIPSAFASLKCLETLDLTGNCIESVRDLSALAKLPRLRRLYLEHPSASTGGQPDGNPVCEYSSTKSEIRKLLPNLEVLNGSFLSLEGPGDCDDEDTSAENSLPPSSASDWWTSSTGENLFCISTDPEDPNPFERSDVGRVVNTVTKKALEETPGCELFYEEKRFGEVAVLRADRALKAYSEFLEKEQMISARSRKRIAEDTRIALKR